MTGSIAILAGPQLLAHIGGLGPHDLLAIIPMAVLSAFIMVIMARPRRPAPGGEQPPQVGGEPADRATPPDHR
jgi:hypothetical protein